MRAWDGLLSKTIHGDVVAFHKYCPFLLICTDLSYPYLLMPTMLKIACQISRISLTSLILWSVQLFIYWMFGRNSPGSYVPILVMTVLSLVCLTNSSTPTAIKSCSNDATTVELTQTRVLAADKGSFIRTGLLLILSAQFLARNTCATQKYFQASIMEPSIEKNGLQSCFFQSSR